MKILFWSIEYAVDSQMIENLANEVFSGEVSILSTDSQSMSDTEFQGIDYVVTLSTHEVPPYTISMVDNEHWYLTDESESAYLPINTLKPRIQKLRQQLLIDGRIVDSCVTAKQVALLDEEIDRRGTPALKVHPMVIGEGEQDIFAAGVADMDFKVPAVITQALQKRLEHGIFGYEAVPKSLLPALLTWLHSRHGWQVRQDHILRSPNILNALAISASIFTHEGDGIIVQPPVFHDFSDIIHENHRTVVLNPLVLEGTQYRMDFIGLEKMASNPRTKMLYLCNPHNPIGRVWRENELRILGDICIRHNVLVVSDEMHGDITFGKHKYVPFASLGDAYADNSITCLSPAKTFNIASACSAFTVIVNAQKRKAFQIENSRLTANKNNAFSNVAMEAAYKYGGLWLDSVLSYLERNVRLVRSHLNEIPDITLIEPEGTFLLWLDVRKLALAPERLTEFLKKEARWAVTRGERFGIEGEGFVRLNIGCTSAKLNSAFVQLKAAVLNLLAARQQQLTKTEIAESRYAHNAFRPS